MEDLAINVIKIFVLATCAFGVAFFLTPSLINFLYKYKLWRKSVRTKSIDGKDLPVFTKFHSEGEVNIPRCGGLLIWMVTLALAFFFFALSWLNEFLSYNNFWLNKFNFLSRSQTWLPLFALVSASLVGLADDIFQIYGKGKYIAGGIKLKYRLLMVALIGLAGAYWFYDRLGYQTIHIPGDGAFFLGIWYIPLFVVVMLATYSGGVVDGLDGLAGGTFSIIFAAFGGISLFTGQYDIASFCFVLTGTLLAFLWFNIPPAKFYMGETGIIGLCSALTVVAFLTDSVIVLPIIAIILVAESGSVIIQLFSKRFLGKKVFLASPIHHHFEALGWPHFNVTMRFWIVGVIFAVIGVAVRLFG